MWASETANDLYNAGVNDDQFVLISKSNENCQVAVKTPWGSLIERKTISNVEMQGGVLVDSEEGFKITPPTLILPQ